MSITFIYLDATCDVNSSFTIATNLDDNSAELQQFSNSAMK